MDCAEGTYGQLFDHLGTKEKVDEALLKTRVIFISHFHADHHLGLLKIINAREHLPGAEKLYLVLPEPIMTWMKFHCQSDLVEMISS
jgi:ribonuclease Z